MPRQLIRQDVTITAAGGTFQLDTAAAVDIYRVTSATITLLAGVSITYTGSLTTGLFYDFEYTADITPDGNTISFFGETMPDNLAAKECQVTAYYNGSTWDVKFIPSINETGIIGVNQLEISPYTLVVNETPLAAIDSTNTVAEETLSSLVVPADTLVADGDTLMIVVAGSTGANANTKTIRLKHSGAGTIISNSTATAPNNRDWRITAFITRLSNTGASQAGSILVNGSVEDFNHSSGGSFYTWSATNTFLVTSECGTGAVGNVVLESFQIYKLVN